MAGIIQIPVQACNVVLVLIASGVFDAGSKHAKSTYRAFAANVFFLIISLAGAVISFFLRSHLKRT